MQELFAGDLIPSYCCQHQAQAHTRVHTHTHPYTQCMYT